MKTKLKKNVEVKMSKRLLLVLFTAVLLLIISACSTNDNAGLTVSIITEGSSSIIAENISLRNNADTTQIIRGKIQSNRIRFTGLEHGSYSLFAGTQVVDADIRVFTNNVAHNITLDSARNEYRVITLVNQSHTMVWKIVLTIADFEDTNATTEVVLDVDIPSRGSHDLVVLGNCLIKHALFFGVGGVYSTRDIDQRDGAVVYIEYLGGPNIVIAFCSQAIGSTTGEIDIFYNDDGIVQIGIESFDQIAREFGFADLIRNRTDIYTSASWALAVPFPAGTDLASIYFQNIFGITRALKYDGVIEALLNDDSILAAKAPDYKF